MPLDTTLPVTHAAENHRGNDAEGEGMKHVGQQHLPLLVQAILTLLVADGSQHGNWHRRHVPKQSVTTPLREERLSKLNLRSAKMVAKVSEGQEMLRPQKSTHYLGIAW